MQIFVVIISVFLLTYFGIKLYLSWSRKKEIYDVPNERSSHTEPTPRGGGLIIVIVCLSSFYGYLHLTGQKILWAYFVAAFLVAIVSWLDDLFSLSIVWRFLCHSAAAALILLTYDFPGKFSAPVIGSYNFEVIGLIFWFLWIVWLINAYNFMDGIDGIAGIQAVSAGLFWAIAGFIFGIETAAYLGLIIAVSAFAFLLYNWQPAKIFMGDVGSAFLGFNFAVLPIIAFQKTSENSAELIFAGILFVWFFIFDSAKTLLQRIFQRRKVWRAHREHLYQKLIIKGYSHEFVSLLYGILTFIISLLSVLYFYKGFPFGLLTVASIILLSAGLLIRVEFVEVKQGNAE